MNAFDLLTLICGAGCALVAGVFFAFSTAVMNALSKLPAAQGIAAMKAINVEILNPLFLGVFLGTAVACAVALIGGLLHWGSPARLPVLGGAVLYLAGSFLVTMRCNVPRNERLRRLDATVGEAAAVWQDYVTNWTAWNHLRTLASLGAAVLFLLPAFLR